MHMFLLPQHFYSIKNTSERGRGVFAQQDIPPGTVIGDYLGTLIKTEVEEHGKDGQLYDMFYNYNATIRPDRHALGIHLINHSCVPNCQMYSYQVHTLYVALRKIWKGEELTVSYFCEPPADISKEASMHPCKCGSIFCRASMHTNHVLTDRWERKMKKKYGATFDKIPVAFDHQLPPLVRYPRTIRYSREFDIYAHPRKRTYLTIDAFPPTSTVHKIIRETGCQIIIKKMNLRIYAILNGYILIKELRHR